MEREGGGGGGGGGGGPTLETEKVSNSKHPRR